MLFMMLEQFDDTLVVCSNRKKQEQAAMHAHHHVKIPHRLHPQTHHPPVFRIVLKLKHRLHRRS